jgi:uncharacterized protein (DUF58 family)
MILPTTKGVALAAASPLLALAIGAVAPQLWSLSLVYLAIVLVALLIDLASAPSSRSLIATIHPPDLVYVGEPQQIAFDLTLTRGRWPVLVGATVDHDPVLALPPRVEILCPPPPPDGAVTVRTEIPVVSRRRGTAHLETLWLRWDGRYGLMRRQIRKPLGIKLRVVPNIRAVRMAAIALSRQDSILGIKDQRQLGDGSEFDALREYQPGFDRRGIDWKHSARHRRLLSKEFRSERNHQIVIAFDTGHLMREPLGGIHGRAIGSLESGQAEALPRLDHAINAGLLLGYASLKGGDRVGLFAFDSRVRAYAQPLGGIDRFPRLQRLTADLEYAAEETNFTLGLATLSQQLKRRSLIVLMTDFVDTVTAELMVENVARLAARHLVLFVTLQDSELREIIGAEPTGTATIARAIVADGLRRERLIVFERLRRLGVQCLEAPHNRIGTDLINRYLAIKQREMI